MNRLIGGLVITNDNPDDPAPNRANAVNTESQPELSNTLNFTLRILHERHRADQRRGVSP